MENILETMRSWRKLMYEYKCKLVKVVDGDTIDIDIDLKYIITNDKYAKYI